MIREFDQFTNEVDKGIAGEVIQIPLQQAKLASKVNMGKRTYMLFGGIPGSGKTAIVDSVFIIQPFIWFLENKDKVSVKPFWIYRSMERAKYLKIAKWTAYLLWHRHGLLIDVPTLLGWSNRQYDLTPQIREWIDDCKPFFEELSKYCIIIDGPTHPTAVINYAEEIARQKGNMIQHSEFDWEYVPNDPNEIVFHVTDHIGRLSKEQGLSKKQLLDLHSSYMTRLRDKYGWSIIDIQQLNRSLESTMRNAKNGRADENDIDVMPSDFKDTGEVYENADVVFGLMNPYKLKAYGYMGYNIKAMVNTGGFNRFRGLKIIKNSFGQDDLRIGYAFFGENGYMQEMHKAGEMTPELYSFYANPSTNSNSN